MNFKRRFNLVMIYVAGYLHIIHQMKELITGAGKKAYTLVMGRPNPAKLANFPEVFLSDSCDLICFTGSLIP